MDFICVDCFKLFKDKKKLLHHRKSHLSYNCGLCSNSFKTPLLLEFHINSTHRCNHCEYESASLQELKEHVKDHLIYTSQSPQFGGRAKKFSPYPFIQIKAFKGYARSFRHRKRRWDKPINTVNDYFMLMKKKIFEILEHCMHSKKSTKIQASLFCEFFRDNEFLDQETNKIEKCKQYFNSNVKIILNKFYVKKVFKQVSTQLNNMVEIFEKNGSGWLLGEVLGLDLRVAHFEILKGGCFAQLDNHTQRKGATVNVKTHDNECFIYAFLAAMHYDNANKHYRNRASQYNKYKSLYNFSDLNYPTTLDRIKKFERVNKDKGFAINVFGYDEDYQICINYLSVFKNIQKRKIINLLLLPVKESSDTGHYVAITSMSRLIGKQGNRMKFPCYRCLNLFKSKKKVQRHYEFCQTYQPQRTYVPISTLKDGTKPVCKFEKFEKKLKSRFCIYADFEAICKRIKCPNTNVNSVGYQNHEPCGYAFCIVDSKQKLVGKPRLYRGPDSMNKFIDDIDAISLELLAINSQKAPMKALTTAEVKSFKNSKYCHICEDKINDPVRDHCHETGKYRGAACRQCNAKFHQGKRIPIIMHNFKSYDLQILLKNVSKFPDEIHVVPHNSEKFLSIIGPTYYFIDSFMFLQSSLDSLVTDMLKDTPVDSPDFVTNFTLMVQCFGLNKAKELSRKGVYPYEYMDSFEKFNEKKFPDISEFYSSLLGENVSEIDYKYGKNIFEKYCKDMGNYHDLYLLTDTLLLASCFESFRSLGLEYYKLDPVHYFSLAGYAWDTALLRTKVKLELITDMEQYNMLEMGLRGGVSMISKRLAFANNKYMKKFDKHKPSKFILYIDKVNLYGECLLKPLPLKDFCWEDPKTISIDDIMLMDDDGCEGRIFEVDLDYPISLHSEHSEYALAPEKIVVTKDQLSLYQEELIDLYDIKYSDKQKKLVPHLGNRKRYVVHYRALKYYLTKGLVLKKIHRIIKFTQSPFLKEHVLHNTELRKKSSSEYKKKLFKFLNNSIYGKSMEQVRNKKKVRILNSKDSLSNYTRLPNFDGFQILSPEMVVVFLKHQHVLLDKPLYIATTVLDDSKMLMYIWHYDKIKQWYGKKAKFLFTDTDSLAYEIETNDLYEDLAAHQDEFDFSDYPQDHFLFSTLNKKRIGKMTDEAGGKILTGFVGVSSKMYIFKGNQISKAACKGVKTSIVRRYLSFDKYYRVLKRQKRLVCKMNLIRSKKHQLQTVSLKKVALHSFDSKRFIFPDGITTLALNHYMCKPLKRLMSK